MSGVNWQIYGMFRSALKVRVGLSVRVKQWNAEYQYSASAAAVWFLLAACVSLDSLGTPAEYCFYLDCSQVAVTPAYRRVKGG